MAPETVRFVFDYVDPGSYLLHWILAGGGPGAGEVHARVHPHPYELRPPPQPVIDGDDPRWTELLEAMAEAGESLGAPFDPPPMVPWTRKAHELALQAAEHGCFEAVHAALFRAYFQEGRDLGRVDTLVRIGEDHGLEASETRAVLDVDRHREEVERRRAEARTWGVRGVPTLLASDGSTLEGFQPPPAVRAFLEEANARSDQPSS